MTLEGTSINIGDGVCPDKGNVHSMTRIHSEKNIKWRQSYKYYTKVHQLITEIWTGNKWLHVKYVPVNNQFRYHV